MKPLAVHERENNSESQEHLEENKPKFYKQCKEIVELFYQGVRLTCKSAMNKYNIGHLPRRIADLRLSGVHVDERWLYDEKGRKAVKEWFINFRTEEEKKELQKFLSELLNEQPPTPKLKPLEQINLF